MKAFIVTAAIAVAGFFVILAGIAMLVLPGPGWATIFFGLWIWSKRFGWAHNLLGWAKRKAHSLKKKVKR